jgi:hypothetical protein
MIGTVKTKLRQKNNFIKKIKINLRVNRVTHKSSQ